MRHYNIPIFMPEMACPHRCVFCNQASISSHNGMPAHKEVIEKVEKHLKSFTTKERLVQLAFFGGNFTGLSKSLQKAYLQLIQPYLKNGLIAGVRISTRPDYINTENLLLLKDFGVTHIELGAQSTNNKVLLASGRGHLYDDIAIASEQIIKNGFVLGLQMMIGLPEDKPETAMQTAHDIVALGAKETRIYPCLVIKDTDLEKLYMDGKYNPLSLADAVEQCAHLFEYFERNKVKVLRLGLHPSDELNSDATLAGPYHPQFAALVFSKLWKNQFINFKHWPDTEFIEISVSPAQINHAAGFKSRNRKFLEEKYRKVYFKRDESLNGRNFKIEVL